MSTERTINHFLLADGNVVHQMQLAADIDDPVSSMVIVKIPLELLDHRAAARLRHLADEIDAHAGGAGPKARRKVSTVRSKP